MAQLKTKSQDHAVAFAAATLLCELLTQRLVTRQTEMLSEALAWVALPFLVRAGRRGGRGRTEIVPPAAASTASASGSNFGVGLFAAGIAVVSFCKAENGTSRFYVSSCPYSHVRPVILTKLQPALVPILLTAHRYMQLDSGDATRGSSRSASSILTSPLVACAIAAVAVIDLFVWNLEKIIYASVALVSISVAYLTLLPQRRRTSVIVPPVRIEENIEHVSKAVVMAAAFAFVIQTLVFGFTTGSVLRTFAVALFKCLSWFFAIHLVSLAVLPPIFHKLTSK